MKPRRLHRRLRQAALLRGVTLPELLAICIATLCALLPASCLVVGCGPREDRPVVVVDPGPPFGPCLWAQRAGLRSVHTLKDGCRVLVLDGRFSHD